MQLLQKMQQLSFCLNGDNDIEIVKFRIVVFVIGSNCQGFLDS
jgi:hypothetical protein